MGQPSLDFFDCNSMVGPMTAVHPEADVSLEALQQRLQEVGIRRILAVHSYAVEYDPMIGNSEISDVSRGAEGIIPCYVLLPPDTREQPEPGERLLRYLDAGDARAVRLYPRLHGFGLDEPWCGTLFACLSEAGVPVLLDFEQTDWGEVERILSRHPGLQLVVVRAGYRIDRWVYPLLEKHPGLHLEISWYQPFGGIEALCQRFGATRLLFGTGAPLWDPSGPVGLVTYSDLSETDKGLISSRNLERLLWKGFQNG